MKIMKNIMKISLIVVSVFFLTTVLANNGKAEAPSSLDSTPVRIAFDGNSDLLVTDYTYGQVLTVAPDTLDIIGVIDIDGRPLGVAWANDLIYVGNSTNGQVEVYNAAGEEQFVLGEVVTPLDIAVGNGNVYVVDGSDKVIKIFTQDGTFVGTIPENGYDPAILTNPTAIAVDDINQQIYVSDYGDLGNTIKPIDPRIQVFNLDGSFAYSINGGTTNNYRFTMPQGLTLNGHDQLFVIDCLTGEILVFDTTTATLLEIINGKTYQGDFMMPLDLVIDATTNDIFVTNSQLGSIEVLAGAGVIE